MIVSVSRRTDIPAYYFDWFLNRLREGFVLVRNPMNSRLVSQVELSPGSIEALVFWTKNPAPMLSRLDRLSEYPYYLQFTLNPYGPDLEPGLPPEAERLETFKKMAQRLGPERVVWRYSPVLINDRYTEEKHLSAFARLTRILRSHTRHCKLSFLDFYPKIRKNMAAIGADDPSEERKEDLARQLVSLAEAAGLSIGACGNLNLKASGLAPARCLDPELLERLTGRPQSRKKDPGQRRDCYCPPSVDIGAYNTCLHGCLYCYANHSPESARKRFQSHDPAAPLLFGRLFPEDIVRVRQGMRGASGALKSLF